MMERWLAQAKFNHAKAREHFMCAMPRRRSQQGQRRTFYCPAKETCVTCHSPRGGVVDTCATCHSLPSCDRRRTLTRFEVWSSAFRWLAAFTTLNRLKAELRTKLKRGKLYFRLRGRAHGHERGRISEAHSEIQSGTGVELLEILHIKTVGVKDVVGDEGAERDAFRDRTIEGQAKGIQPVIPVDLCEV